MPRIMSKITVPLIILLLVGAQVALAQDADRFARRIQRLDEDIQHARELAISFNSERALKFVEQAQKERDAAVELAREGRFVRAEARIEVARAFLEQAVQVILNHPIRRMRSQLEDLLRKADEIVPPSQNNQALRTLDRAKQNRDAAERNVMEMKVARAVEHFRIAISLAEQAIELAQRSNTTDVDRLGEERRKFETLRDRAREAVEKSGNEQARRVYLQALEIYAKAEEAFYARQLDTAKRLLNQSSLLLLRALDIASVDSDQSSTQAERELASLQQQLQRANELIGDAANTRVLRLIERARTFEQEAAIAIQNGRPNVASWKIDLAQKLLQRAQRVGGSVSGDQFSNRLSEEIAASKSDLQTVESLVAADASRDAQVLVRMARICIERAEQAAAAGLSRVALEGVLAAQRFMDRAESFAQQDGPNEASRSQIETRFLQLDAATADVESKTPASAPEWRRRLIQNAKEIRQLAYDSYQNGNLNAANEAIQVSFELLRKSSKNAGN